MSLAQTVTRAAPLPDMPCGCKLRVEELTGSPSMRSRLYAMGILPGTEMEICGQSCGKGSVCVRVRHCSLVLGESMAQSIFCTPAGDGETPRHGHCRRPWRHGHGHGHGHGDYAHPESGHGSGCCCAQGKHSTRME